MGSATALDTGSNQARRVSTAVKLQTASDTVARQLANEVNRLSSVVNEVRVHALQCILRTEHALCPTVQCLAAHPTMCS